MTTYLLDNFDGSADLNGTVPEVPLSPGFPWGAPTGLAITESGGYAAVGSPANANSAGTVTSGDRFDNTGFGKPAPLRVTFTMLTPPNIGVVGGVSHGGLQLLIWCGRIEYKVKVWGYYNGTTLDWYMNVGEGTPFHIITGDLTANTEYTGIVDISAAGVQTFTFLGRTLSLTTAFTHPLVGYHGGSVLLWGYTKIARLQVTSNVDGNGDLPPSYLGTAAITLPSPTLSASGTGPISASSFFALPPLSAFATAHDATGERAFNGTLPSLGLAAFGGANARLTAPALALSITGRATIMGAAPLILPALSLSAAGRAAWQAAAALQLPAIRAGGFSGAVASVTIGGVTLSASGTMGGVSRANLTLPLFELTAGATRQRSGSANVTLPALRTATTGAAQIVIPGLRLTAIGTATVAVAYEAYALNLKHNAEVNDELTHYTNYPFDRIVRYKNSYYGMNSTGLYLLEGTTDFAEPAPTPIAWSWKTTLTDFESAQQKTVQWAYFGGRMGPAATVSIYYGDTGQESYAYASPRGASAQNYRQGFGRGIKSRYYALGAAGSGALALDHIVFNIATLARKV